MQDTEQNSTELLLENSQSPNLIARSVLVILLLTGLFCLFAYSAKFDEVIKVGSKVISSQPNVKVQTLNGGVVEEIHVQQGNYVSAGQEIASIYNSTMEGEYRNLENQVTMLHLENEVYDSLLNDTKPIFESFKAEKKYINDYNNLHQVLNEQEELDSISLARQINANNQKIAKLESQLDSLAESLDAQVLVSSKSGLVKALQVDNIGEIILPKHTIAEIVPLTDEVIVEAMVPPQDIGKVEIGQQVKVKISAFDFIDFGVVYGKLQTISPATFVAKGSNFYKATIVLDKNYVGEDSNKNLILPGMQASSEFIVGQKTLLQYLLTPARRAFKNSFSES